MAVKISDLMIMTAIAIAVFMGSITVMGELANNYGVSVPESSNTHITEIYSDVNKTANELQSTMTGDKSWLETAFSVVFALPNTVTSTMVTMANSAGKLIGMATGEDMLVPIPSWVTMLVYLLIAIVITTTLVYLIMGRGM